LQLAPPPSLEDDVPTIFLKPATLYCTDAPTIITTLLGSCVAVCLWDRQRSVAGMNHFVLPHDPRGLDRRYGDVAIDQLVASMAALGCDRENVEAKVFGGAEVLSLGGSENNVGSKNVDMAVTRLERHRIPVTARRTGGEDGLLIRLTTQTGEVLVRRI
jgi:chemotaxis protein CheD